MLEIDEGEEEEDNGEGDSEGGRARGSAQEEPIMIDVEPMEVERSEAPVRATRATRAKRAPSREPEATAPPKATRTQQQQRGKGKAATRRNFSPNVMEIDSATDNAQGEESDVFVQPALRKDKQKANGSSAAISEREFARLQKENEQLRKQVEEVRLHRLSFASVLIDSMYSS